MCLVPSLEGVSQNSVYSSLVLAYDLDERANHLFHIRKCSKEERQSAKEEFLVAGYSGMASAAHTPASVQSFYSPNFFTRRFPGNQSLSA